ncbi:MAG: glutamine--tRNA ligase/YqeY domain fusion protein [Gemmatimonadota bacterium]|nr:glutamine--tRNA ligase/YqeY domain fusion protein [Gemmatimonadota bacterium]
MSEQNETGSDFIRRRVEADLASGRYGGRVVTRFPPEPNGYLHIGHATAICLNFGIAEQYGGRCHLRFDDTNPEKEDPEYVRAIQDDIRWLGFDWGEHLYFASDYFEKMYECAEGLIRDGLAYVDSQPLEAIREGRGSLTEPGVDSPYRDRSVDENLDLFRRMRSGEFPDGAHVLRGKIDMAAPNMLMRDPVLYRIRHAEHYRQGDRWCIYPLYDYAHCLEDAFEDVTHSICTIEFENNRDIYDWVLEHTGFEEPRPHQHEWAGLDLENAVLSKRAIGPLVAAGLVSGWDDPRLATIAAYRRRGVPPEAIRKLARMVGVSRSGARTEEAKFDFAIREVLNTQAPRVMAVLDPLRVVITNLPEGHLEDLDAAYFPSDVAREGSRALPFSRELWIERSDFEEVPPKGFRRLVPGGEVRLRHAYVIRCDEVVKNEGGAITELRCSMDPDTKGGAAPGGRKVKGTIHWVSVAHAVDAEVRLFGPLLEDAGDGSDPTTVATGGAQDGGEPVEVDITERVDPESLIVVRAKIEPSVTADPPETRYQFERTGYFWRDPVDGRMDDLVFNRIVAMKSTYRPGGGVAKADESAAGVPTRPKQSKGRGDKDSTVTTVPKPQVGEGRAIAREEDATLRDRFTRYQQELGLSREHADVLTRTRRVGDFFEAALAEHDDPVGVAAWLVTDVRGLLDGRTLGDLPFGGRELGRLAALVANGSVTRRAAKDVLARLAEQGGDPRALVAEMGLEALADTDQLSGIVDGVLAAWPGKVEEYRAGNENLIGLFVGEVMKVSKGAADPRVARTMLIERLRS